MIICNKKITFWFFMDSKLFTLIILLSFPLFGTPVQPGLNFTTAVASSTACEQNAEVNFDELEDMALGCNAFEKAEFSKPSKLLVLIRILGMPLFNAYLKMTDSMARISAWVSAVFKKNNVNAYEAR